MNKLYVMEGLDINNDKSLCLSHSYDINISKSNKIADLNLARHGVACAVFEGKIVVTGGYDYKQGTELKSVEAYDYYDNKWTYLPDMIEERYGHASVSMGDKMFVIDGKLTASCEVFESFSRKFSAIKSDIKLSSTDVVATDFF